jgi:hypothetical protein
MSAEVVLGLDAVLTIDGAEIKNVKDLTVSLEKAEADASTRDNNGWRATVGTLKDASIEFTVLNKSGDLHSACFKACGPRARHATSISPTPAAALVLTCEVMSFNVNQNLEEVVSADVTLKPTQSASGAGVNVPVASGV